MARLLKQSTAFTFRIGPFVDSTDGFTAETALSIAQADLQISKAGGAFAQTSASPTTTHDADGWYQCPLTTTDTNTLGSLTVQIVMAGALPVWEHFMVLTANVYDSLVGGSDLLDVNATQWNSLTTVALPLVPTTAGRTLDVSAGGEAGLDWANIGSPTTAVNLSGTNIDVDQVVASVSGAVASVTGAVGSVTGNVGGNVTGSVGTVNALAANVITAAATAADFTTEIQTGLATAAALATVGSNVDAILVDTAEIGAAGAGLTALATQASVNTIDDFLDTEVAAIKAKTDQLTFTVANQLDANVESINATAVLGVGTSGNKWRG